uniref:Ovule protein n=1 Tax=Schistosoma curassoni TaxID=6186 RepID=A0A183K1R1_9TREM
MYITRMGKITNKKTVQHGNYIHKTVNKLYFSSEAFFQSFLVFFVSLLSLLLCLASDDEGRKVNASLG